MSCSFSWIYAFRIKHIHNVCQTYTLSSSYIYDMFHQHSLYVHCRYTLLAWCGAYTRMVSSHSRRCQKPLETMSKVTPRYAKSYSADCSAVIIRKNYPPIHQTPRKPRYTGRLRMVYSFRTIHQLYTILFTKTVNRPQKTLGVVLV